MQEFLDKLNKLPNFQKMLIMFGMLGLVVFLYFWLLYLPKQQEIKSLQETLSKTEVDLAEKKAIADNLPKFQEEVARLDEELQKQLKKLPNKAEIPKILRTISNLGKKAGLEFTLFSPQPESTRDFYAEVPLQITVEGNYHQIAVFFDKVSQLNRIVNVKGITMTQPHKKGGKTMVNANATLLTYRFLENTGE